MSAFVAVNQCRLCVDFSFLFYTRRLLEFYFNRESGKPCGVATFDVPLLAFEFSDLDVGKLRSPFISLLSPALVSDTRTHILYELPRFLIALVCGTNCM